jgi:hypothetical protein
MHTKPGVAEQFINDVKECTAYIVANPTAQGAKTVAIHKLTIK